MKSGRPLPGFLFYDQNLTRDGITLSIFSDSFAKRSGFLAPKLIRALQSRNFEAFYCRTASEAASKALSLIPEGSTVSWGGSETIREIGLLDRVRRGNYKVLDRDEAASPEERLERMRQALLCDVFLTSFNAVSEDGVLVDVDSLGNRAAAVTFGPRSVIAVVGMNKVCRTPEDAERRARTYAAPINAARLSLKGTPCTVTGTCENCRTRECICSYIVKTRMSKIPGRIKVILVGEPLGF